MCILKIEVHSFSVVVSWEKPCRWYSWEIQHNHVHIQETAPRSRGSQYLDLEGKLRKMKTEVPRGRESGLLWKEHPFKGEGVLEGSSLARFCPENAPTEVCAPDPLAALTVINPPPHPEVSDWSYRVVALDNAS